MSSNATTLWVISDELEAIGEKIAEHGGELTPELEAELEAVEGAFADKVERIALFIRESELNAVKAGMEEKRIKAIRVHHESKVSGLKSYLLAVMERQGRDKVDTPKARVTRTLSPPSYCWTGDDYEAIPDGFRDTRVIHKLDVGAVKDAITDGKELPEGIVVARGHHILIS